MKNETKELNILNKIAQAIYDKKGFNILVLNVKEISSMTDYFIIAEANVDRHVKAIAESLIDMLEPIVGPPGHIEGLHSPEWVVIDYYDFIIHLFIPEMREKYSLEKVWKAGSIVDVKIKVHP